MKFKGLVQMLALLLALVIALGACDFGGSEIETTAEEITTVETTADETTSGNDTTSGETTSEETTFGETTAEETTAEETTAEETTAEETTSAETTEKNTSKEEETTEAELSEYRASISKSIKEIKAMYTLTDEYFDEALAKLAEFEEKAILGENLEEVDALYDEFEDMFYHIATQVSIATLIYYYDTSVEETNTQYLNANEKYGDMYNAYVETCKKVYENSPIRDELFADWTEADLEELFDYSPELQDLSQRNEELLVELNGLEGQGFYDRAAEIYAEIVMNNNKIAELNGYDNYYDYASTEIYGRDYDREDIEAFRELVRENFFLNADTLLNGWLNDYYNMSMMDSNKVYNFLYGTFDYMPKNHVEGYINSFAGTSTYEGFRHMLDNKNILFADSPNSHQSAFQLYLYELETPFCLYGSNGQSASTIVHEMGHYYASLYNSDVFSYDLAETQSQSNELLFLKYLESKMSTEVYGVIKGYNMYNFAVMAVVCVIIDEFEQRVYALESTEGYTSADFDAIMEDICQKYGGVAYLNENIVDINNYWRSVATNNPVYYISYAVSIVSSLSIFAAAEEDEAAAREIYRILIEETEENETFMSAVERSGLASPFDAETFAMLMPVILNK